MKTLGPKLLTTLLLLAHLVLPVQAAITAVGSVSSQEGQPHHCMQVQHDSGSSVQSVDGCCDEQANGHCDMSNCSQCQMCSVTVGMTPGLSTFVIPSAGAHSRIIVSYPEGIPPSHLQRPPIALS